LFFVWLLYFFFVRENLRLFFFFDCVPFSEKGCSADVCFSVDLRIFLVRFFFPPFFPFLLSRFLRVDLSAFPLAGPQNDVLTFYLLLLRLIAFVFVLEDFFRDFPFFPGCVCSYVLAGSQWYFIFLDVVDLFTSFPGFLTISRSHRFFVLFIFQHIGLSYSDQPRRKMSKHCTTFRLPPGPSSPLQSTPVQLQM